MLSRFHSICTLIKTTIVHNIFQVDNSLSDLGVGLYEYTDRVMETDIGAGDRADFRADVGLHNAISIFAMIKPDAYRMD